MKQQDKSHTTKYV